MLPFEWMMDRKVLFPLCCITTVVQWFLRQALCSATFCCLAGLHVCGTKLAGQDLHSTLQACFHACKSTANKAHPTTQQDARLRSQVPAGKMDGIALENVKKKKKKYYIFSFLFFYKWDLSLCVFTEVTKRLRCMFLWQLEAAEQMLKQNHKSYKAWVSFLTSIELASLQISEWHIYCKLTVMSIYPEAGMENLRVCNASLKFHLLIKKLASPASSMSASGHWISEKQDLLHRLPYL